MTKLAENLKTLMAHQGLSCHKLAQLTGIAQPILHRLTNGKTTNPRMATLAPIANHFDIPLHNLVSGDARAFCRRHTHKMNEQKLPVFCFEEMHKTDNPQPIREVYPDTRHLSKASFAIHISHTAGMPLYPPNTVLIIDPEQESGNEQFALIRQTGTDMFAVMQTLFDGIRWYLQPLNMKLPPVPLTPNIHIIGPVIQAIIHYR